jgi:hypothetical protein
LATTGIGGVPFDLPADALGFALGCDLPYLPQLRSERMIPSALDGLPGVALVGEGACAVDPDVWKRSANDFRLVQSACLAGFVPQVRKRAFGKVQIAGPVTVRTAVKLTTGEPLSALPGLEDQLIALLLAKSEAMISAVRSAEAQPVLFLDEPSLSTTGFEDLQAFLSALRPTGALLGLHCCGQADWARVLRLPLDVVSFDVRLSLDAVLDARAERDAFLSRGGTFALGIIGTNPDEQVDLPTLLDSVEVALRSSLPRGMRFEALLSRMWLTPACGLSLRSPDDAASLTAALERAQQALRALL